MFTFHLRDIQVCHMESVLFLHPCLDLFICSPLLKPGHIHIFKREFNSDILTRDVSLGKLDNSLDVLRVRKHVDRDSLLHAVAVLREVVEVPGERHGITGDVDDLLRRKFLRRFKKSFCRPGSRRVHKQHVDRSGTLFLRLRARKYQYNMSVACTAAWTDLKVLEVEFAGE